VVAGQAARLDGAVLWETLLADKGPHRGQHAIFWADTAFHPEIFLNLSDKENASIHYWSLSIINLSNSDFGNTSIIRRLIRSRWAACSAFNRSKVATRIPCGRFAGISCPDTHRPRHTSGPAMRCIE
jgi:hypothetical protein